MKSIINKPLLVFIISLTFFSGCAHLKALLDKPTVEKTQVKKKPRIIRNKYKTFFTQKINKYSDSKIGQYQSILTAQLKVSDLPVEVVNFLQADFFESGKKYKVNPVALLALAKHGSKLNPAFESGDRYGLIPLSHAQASTVANLYRIEYKKTEDLLSPALNLDLAAASIRFYLDVFKNNYHHALLAYNWGADETSKFLDSTGKFPKEQYNFLKEVLDVYKDLLKTPSEIEEESKQTVKEAEKKLPKTTTSSPKPTPKVKRSAIALPKYFVTSKKNSPTEYQQRVGEIIKQKASVADAEGLSKAITEHSLAAGIDPVFVAALVYKNSQFNTATRSADGGLGLLQIRPEQGKYWSQITNIPWQGEFALNNPDYNLKLGIAALKICHKILNNSPKDSLVAFRMGIKEFLAAAEAGQVPQNLASFPQQVQSTYTEWSKVNGEGLD